MLNILINSDFNSMMFSVWADDIEAVRRVVKCFLPHSIFIEYLLHFSASDMKLFENYNSVCGNILNEC